MDILIKIDHVNILTAPMILSTVQSVTEFIVLPVIVVGEEKNILRLNGKGQVANVIWDCAIATVLGLIRGKNARKTI